MTPKKTTDEKYMKKSRKTHGVIVRMDFSPRLIWGTPSSQPIRHH